MAFSGIDRFEEKSLFMTEGVVAKRPEGVRKQHSALFSPEGAYRLRYIAKCGDIIRENIKP